MMRKIRFNAQNQARMDARVPSPILLASAAMSGSKPAPFIRAFT